MSLFTLMHGEPADVVRALDESPDAEGLVMALINAFVRIERLERELLAARQLQASAGLPRPPAESVELLRPLVGVARVVKAGQ